MKFVANRSVLAGALAAVTRIIETKSVIPILENVKVEAGDGKVTLTATNSEISISTSAEAHVLTPGASTLPGRRLNDLVQSLPTSADVTISLNDTGQKASFVSGRSRATLAVLPAVDYPALDPVGEACSFEIAAGDFLFLLDEVDFLASKAVTDLQFCGVHLHVQQIDGDLRLRSVASDRQWLGYAERSCPDGAGNMPPVIVPNRTVAELKRLTKDAGDETIRVEVSERKIAASIGRTLLVSKLVEGLYPEYARVLPTKLSSPATVDAGDLGSAIGRISSFMGDNLGGANFEFDPAGGLTIKANNQGLGDIEEHVGCEFGEGAQRVIWNAGRVKRLVGALAGDTIEIALSPSSMNSIWRVPSDPSRTYLLGMMRKV